MVCDSETVKTYMWKVEFSGLYTKQSSTCSSDITMQYMRSIWSGLCLC